MCCCIYTVKESGVGKIHSGNKYVAFIQDYKPPAVLPFTLCADNKTLQDIYAPPKMFKCPQTIASRLCLPLIFVYVKAPVKVIYLDRYKVVW